MINSAHFHPVGVIRTHLALRSVSPSCVADGGGTILTRTNINILFRQQMQFMTVVMI